MIIGLLVMLIKSTITLQYARGAMYYYGLHLLGCVNDDDGIYRCYDPETVASVGMYLITESENLNQFK